MNDIEKIISDFFNENQGRLYTKKGNVVANSLGNVLLHYNYLKKIQKRFQRYNKAYFSHFTGYKTIFPPNEGSVISKKQEQWLNKTRKLNFDLQFEIESFYLFAKILLDKTAQFIEFYFGRVEGKSIVSHHKFSKNLKDYCDAKNLKYYKQIEEKVHYLQKTISDFRDKQLVHEKSPRTTRGISLGSQGETTMMILRLFPKDSDSHTNSISINNLYKNITEYFKMVILFIEKNNREVN